MNLLKQNSQPTSQVQLPSKSVNIVQELNDKPIYLNIKLILENNNQTLNQEMIQDVQINNFLTKNKIVKKRKLLLSMLIDQLKNTMNFPIESNLIYFYLDNAKIFMKCGKDPISPDIQIRPQDFMNKVFITIKAINKKQSRVYSMIKLQNKNSSILDKKKQYQNSKHQTENQNKKTMPIQEEKKKSKGGHADQRKIGNIIQCVQKWQMIYSEGKLSLDKAAKLTTIPKKSLDEYLYQLRKGHQNKFNFNQHYDDKIGLLRDFVKKKKNAQLRKKQAKLVKKQKKQQQRKLKQQKYQDVIQQCLNLKQNK